MIETKREVNYKIDWHSIDNSQVRDSEIFNRILADRQHYFDMLRRFLGEIDALFEEANSGCKMIPVEKLEAVFKRYNVHFVDIDDVKRVNLDEPIKIEEDGK